MELVEGRTLRRRIAALVWIPAAVAMLALGSWTSSLAVGLVGFAVLIAGLWFFTERWDRVVGRLRRRREPGA
jgi:O-antigen ligase